MFTVPPSASLVGNLTPVGLRVSQARTPSPLLCSGGAGGFFIQLAGHAMARSAGLTVASARKTVIQFSQHQFRPFMERLGGALAFLRIAHVPSVAVSSLMTGNHKGQSRCVTKSEQKKTDRKKS